jgi:hypothetical protein
MFKFCTANQDEENARDILLCFECAQHLIHDDTKIANMAKYSWPGFIWSVLSKQQLHEQYGNLIWKLLPREWRHWWLPNVKSYLPTFEEVTLEDPTPVICDRTTSLENFKKDIDSFSLSRLRDTCDEHLMPILLCPWGCSGYLHKCGHLSLDIMFQRYLPKCYIAKFFSDFDKEFPKLTSARDDFIRMDMDYENWLFNPAWKVMPSVAFVDNKGPVFLSCLDHKNGSEKMMIHTCRLPNHILPAKYPDQIGWAVIESRMIKPLKVTQFGNQYQMHEQKGTFNGIDTFSLTDFTRLDFTSKLLGEYEARAIINRPDINANLSRLVAEKRISKVVANSRRQEAKEVTHGFDYGPYKNGATYVPFEVAMMMLKVASTNAIETSVIVDDRGNDSPIYNRSFKASWPSFIYPLQVMNEFGARFPAVPPMRHTRHPHVQDSDVMTLWTLVALITRIEKLWNLSITTRLHTSKWPGWVLIYSSAHCFKNLSSKQDPRDPFKKIKLSTIPKVLSKVHCAEKDLSQIFFEFERVFCIDCNQDDNFYDGVNPSVHEVLIFYNFELDVTGDEIEEFIQFESEKYELRFIASTWHTERSWDSFVYSRHGGQQFTSWWYQSRSDKITTQWPQPNFEHQHREKKFILAYVKMQSPNIEQSRAALMEYIGEKKTFFAGNIILL